MAMVKLLRRGAKLVGAALGIVSVVSSTAPSQAKAEEKSGGAGMPQGEKAQANVILQEQLTELITTSGQGQIVAKPDSMRAELGVEVRTKTLEQAQTELARKITMVTSAVEKLGLEGLTLQTATLQIQPIQDEPTTGRAPKIVGYRAQNTLSITLRAAEQAELGAQAGKIVDAGVRAGANLVQGISFFLARPEAAQAKALHMAAMDAERNAKILAASSGVRLLAIHSIDGAPDRVGPLFFGEAFALRAATTVEPGEITISANVTARFHFSKQ